MPIVLEKGSKINLTKKDTKKVGKINIKKERIFCFTFWRK